MGFFDPDGYEKPSKKEMREDRAREFNRTQKSITKFVGDNMASVGVILIVILFISYIWTDFSIRLEHEKIILDAVVFFVFSILMESLCAKIGIKGGKLDEEYIKSHEDYLSLRKTVTERGLALMDKFCAWQIDVEYEEYLRQRCKELEIEYKDYVESLSKLSLEELAKVCGADIAAKVFALRQTKRIKLSSQILMTDGEHTSERGGVGISASEYIKHKTVGWVRLISIFLSGAFSAAIAFSYNNGASWGLVMYTITKLSLLAWRMYNGYSSGAKAYNTIEVKHLQDKMLYLNLYIEFLNKKTYLSFGDKYGEIPGEATEAVAENKPS